MVLFEFPRDLATFDAMRPRQNGCGAGADGHLAEDVGAAGGRGVAGDGRPVESDYAAEVDVQAAPLADAAGGAPRAQFPVTRLVSNERTVWESA